MPPTRYFGQNPPSLATVQRIFGVVAHVLLHETTARMFAVALPEARVIASASAGAFAKRLEREPADVAIVDPSVDRGTLMPRTSGHPLIRALAAASAPPFILYLSDGQASLPLRSALIRLRPAMIAARGVDDSREHLRRIVEQTTASRVPEDLLQLIHANLELVRPHIRDALSYALRSPLECDSVENLASVAGISSRAMRREMSHFGLAVPRDWLAAARVLRAHWELRDPAVRIRHLVALMGYSSEDPLASDVATITGRTPSGLRLISSRELIESVACRLIVDRAHHSINNRRGSAVEHARARTGT